MPSAGIALRRPALNGETIVEQYQAGTAKKSQIALPTSCASPVARMVGFETATTRLLAGHFKRKHSGDALVNRLDRRECPLRVIRVDLACPRHVRLEGNLGNAGCPGLPVGDIGFDVKETSSLIYPVCCISSAGRR